MNDLRTLAAALAQDDPSPDVVARSRHRLQNHLFGHRPTRRRSWLAVTATVTATVAAAAVALTVLSPPTTPAPTPAAPGQDGLLAAARAAEQAPADSGTYWYVRTETDTDTLETWTAQDGQVWRRYNEGKPKRLPESVAGYPFPTQSNPLTFEELRALPTDPAELRDWLAESVADQPKERRAGSEIATLADLVSTLPAPPKVRAAALRVLAEYPGVTPLGELPDGQGMRLPDFVRLLFDARYPLLEPRLVVDLKTDEANGGSITVTGTSTIFPGHKVTSFTAKWTDSLP